MNPIKILILTANPSNTGSDPLGLDAEVRRIEEAFQRSQYRDRFQITTKLATRTIDLRRALLDYKPQIVHFSGHGTGEKGLVLENDAGKMQLVSTDALAGLFSIFETGDIECVLLNACYSETQATAIHQFIDCVIGMNQPIGDKAAVRFAEGFYDALGAGSDYEEAYKIGCSAIALEGSSEYSTPVLKNRKRRVTSRLGDQTVSQPLQPQPQSPNRESGGTKTFSKRNNSISIGGSVTGSAITSGDNNTVSVTFQQASLPEPATVNITTEIDALRQILASLSLPDRRKIDRALEDVEYELKQPEPDKNEVGTALERAMTAAQKASGFAEAIDKLRPHVEKTVAWLGENWHKLLPLVGLAI